MRNTNIYDDLKNDVFKEQVVCFLISDWSCNDRSILIGDETILINLDRNCYKLKAKNKEVFFNTIEVLQRSKIKQTQ